MDVLDAIFTGVLFCLVGGIGAVKGYLAWLKSTPGRKLSKP